jgi:opacity protein-like surface antigen
MKKILLLATILLSGSTIAHAQSIKIGVKAGLNYANQTGTTITVNSKNYQTEAISSYHAGLVAELHLFKGLAVQPEMLYSTQGATYKGVSGTIGDITNKVGYLSIPVLVKINLSKSISLELGPQASFLLSEKDNVDFSKSNTFDFAVAGGLGLKVTKSIFLQARYGLGLTEISKEAKTKNSVVQLSAGVLF